MFFIKTNSKTVQKWVGLPHLRKGALDSGGGGVGDYIQSITKDAVMLEKPDKTLISASISCFLHLDGTLTGHYATQLISPFIVTCYISFDAQTLTDT